MASIKRLLSFSDIISASDKSSAQRVGVSVEKSGSKSCEKKNSNTSADESITVKGILICVTN